MGFGLLFGTCRNHCELLILKSSKFEEQVWSLSKLLNFSWKIHLLHKFVNLHQWYWNLLDAYSLTCIIFVFIFLYNRFVLSSAIPMKKLLNKNTYKIMVGIHTRVGKNFENFVIKILIMQTFINLKTELCAWKNSVSAWVTLNVNLNYQFNEKFLNCRNFEIFHLPQSSSVIWYAIKKKNSKSQVCETFSKIKEKSFTSFFCIIYVINLKCVFIFQASIYCE